VKRRRRTKHHVCSSDNCHDVPAGTISRLWIFLLAIESIANTVTGSVPDAVPDAVTNIGSGRINPQGR